MVLEYVVNFRFLHIFLRNFMAITESKNNCDEEHKFNLDTALKAMSWTMVFLLDSE